MEIGKLTISVDSSAVTKAADEVARLIDLMSELESKKTYYIDVVGLSSSWSEDLIKGIIKDIGKA